MKITTIMNPIKLLVLISLATIVLIGCDKDEHVPIELYEANIAPCEVTEEILEIENIIYGPTAKFPHATLTITFVNTSLQYSFNKVPTTGMYYMVPNLVGSYNWDNQMATVRDSGSFLAYSYVTDYPEVHIDNYNNELIISYCDLSNSGFYNFDPTINAYSGNPTGNRKVRMSY